MKYHSPTPAGGGYDGKRLKQQAHETLEKCRCPWAPLAQYALFRVLLEQGTVTLEDIRRLVSVPTVLVGAGIIVAIGYSKSARKEARRRPNIIWKLINSAAARDWLARKPAPSDETPSNGPDTTRDSSDSGEATP